MKNCVVCKCKWQDMPMPVFDKAVVIRGDVKCLADYSVRRAVTEPLPTYFDRIISMAI